jgi:hypothetical protein
MRAIEQRQRYARKKSELATSVAEVKIRIVRKSIVRVKKMIEVTLPVRENHVG